MLFIACHTIAALQENYSLQHNDLHPGNILFVPSDRFVYMGRTLSQSSHMRYSWGGRTYEFPTPAVIPKVIDFGMR